MPTDQTITVGDVTSLSGDTWVVVHMTPPNWSAYPDTGDTFSSNDYTAIAMVDSDPSDLFYYTNNVDSSWVDGGVVIALADSVRDGARSLSVGDIVINQDMQAWMVAPIGWYSVTIA